MVEEQFQDRTMSTIPVTLKWNKQVYELNVELGESATRLKERVATLTGVPMSRQKLLSKKGGWKGALPNDIIFNESTFSGISSLSITLIGSAETLDGPKQQPTFLEDLSAEQLQRAEEAEFQAALVTAEGMIPAMQLPPHRRDDQKQEFYEYNRLVTGLPQRQIEEHLKTGQGANNQELQGKVVMNLGLELRRGYVNGLAVMDDGTCIGALDDGHVQLWKHGAQQQDSVLVPGGEGGVDSVVALRQRQSSQVAFATTGRGNLQLWSSDGDAIMAVPGAMPGTTPASLVCVYGGTNKDHQTENDDIVTCLATRFQITRPENPFQFRLPPQNEEERRRRTQAEAQELAIQSALDKAARSIQIWFSIHEKQTSSSSQSSTSYPTLRYKILEPSGGLEGSAPITAMACLALPDSSRFLVAGDTMGGLRIWQVTVNRANNMDLEFQETAFYQLGSPENSCSIICMEPLGNGRLAVSTDVATRNSSRSSQLLGATLLPITTPRAVHVLDLLQSPNSVVPITIRSTLTGHVSDSVICMCQLPNGDLLTGGGKLDATLQLWSRSQVEGVDGVVHSQSRKKLTEVGYVFSLAVLLDTKKDSNYYAVAAGRYNTIKIII